jgi:uncharacterized protein
MATEIQQLKIIAFFDGRPGHEKQTRGILRELGQMVDIDLTEVKVSRRNILAELLDLAGLFISSRDRREKGAPAANLLLGTGSQTHVPMLKMKQVTGAPAVTCMTPASYLRNFFDLCFVPYHDGIAAGANIMITTGPPNCAGPAGKKDSRKGLILIGGIDRKSHHWNSTEIAGYVRQLTGAEPAIGWTVATSPRTPVETVTALDAVAHDMTNVALRRFADTGPGWIEERYAECLKVWVTADSMSMVYEALSAGCRVGLLPVRWTAEKNKFRRSAEYLIENGLAVPLSAWLAGREGEWPEREPLNEAKRCAEEIVKRWLAKN